MEVSSRPPTVKLLVFPFHVLFFGSESLSPAYTQGEGNQAPLPGEGRRVFVDIIWNFSIRNTCLFSPIYLFTYSIIYLYPKASWVCILFCEVLIQYYNYLLCNSDCPSFDLWALFQVDSWALLGCYLPPHLLFLYSHPYFFPYKVISLQNPTISYFS